MVIILHVAIALISIIFTTYVYISPSQRKLKLAYMLVSLTAFSGFYLVVSAPGHILQSCVMGLLYVAVVGAAIVQSHRKLARVPIKSN